MVSNTEQVPISGHTSSPLIPSPTPITGIHTTGGKPALRLPVDELQTKYPLAFNLYIQALSAWQNDGNREIDRDNDVGTGYFQVNGIHGVPFESWQNDPTPPAYPNIQAGYCTHRSVLFVPWHRPYLALYEQIIFAYAEQVAKGFTGPKAQQYAEALKQVRLPYWDWAVSGHLPEVTKQENIEVEIPGSKQGTTTIQSIHNPLYSYVYTSGYAQDLLNKELEPPQVWNESKRCPNAEGQNQMNVADDQIFKRGPALQKEVFNIMSIKDFGQFSCTAWKKKTDPSQYPSLEDAHNTVHNFIGTEDTTKAPTGNMTDVYSSSFDPIFWLHHTNIDRLAAIWQAIHPNCVIDTLQANMDRYTERQGINDSGASNLEPFHQSAVRKDYFTAESQKEVTSTFLLGYYYKETPLQYFNDPGAMTGYATEQYRKLYEPSKPKFSFRAPSEGGETGTPVDISPPQVRTDWQAFVRVNQFAISGTWGIHVFIGDAPANSDEWAMASNLVGTVSVLAPSNRNHCANCRGQADRNLLVTGAVDLTEMLRREFHDTTDDETVASFLKEHMTWKVAKACSSAIRIDATNVPVTAELDLVIGVSATPITYPADKSQMPIWGETVVWYSVTADKDGGLSGHDQL